MPNRNSFLEKLLKKQFPTLLGIGILLIALVAGIFLLSSDTSVFSPRATPESTPKKVKITNLTDTGFTISFLTDDNVAGFVKYGPEKELKNQISDDRDQLSGTIGNYQTHHITVRGLNPNTTYYYTIGTGTGVKFDNNGQPFSIKTLSASRSPQAAKTVYGQVTSGGTMPAVGAIVYLKIEGAGELSGLVKDSGNWAIPLSAARNPDGAYTAVTEDTALTINVQGLSADLIASVQATVRTAAPLASLNLGTVLIGGDNLGGQPAPTPQIYLPPDSQFSTSSADSLRPTPLPTPEIFNPPGTDDLTASPAPTPQIYLPPHVVAGGLGGVLETTEISSFNVTDEAIVEPELTTTQPVFTGQVTPSTSVRITINSDTQIKQTVTTDAKGNFVIDLSQLEKELEPGEHTVSYCYNDNNGDEICQTKTFTIKPKATPLAQVSSSVPNLPYGSGNPYAIGGATKSATASQSATATSSSKGGLTSNPSTASGVPVSGSVETTLALIIGGMFFILAGGWSYYLAIRSENTNL